VTEVIRDTQLMAVDTWRSLFEDLAAPRRKTLESLGIDACISVFKCHRYSCPKIGGARMERKGGDCWKAITWAESLPCEDVLCRVMEGPRATEICECFVIGGSACLDPELEGSTRMSGNTMERLRID
jgi:hypothetical protein